MKNKYFAIIFNGCINKKPVRKIHKELYDATINLKPHYQDKYLLGYAIKLCNKSHKISGKTAELLALSLFALFDREKVNDKAKKIINYDVGAEAEKRKNNELLDFIDDNRDKNAWFYLASSHNDCAKDHKEWQGKLYVDEKAPKSAIDWAKSRGLYTLQWVIGSPVWFITRPNCRHYFVSLTEREVRKKSVKKLKRKYKTHRKEGNYELQTPARMAVEEYEDRLKMLRALYREYPLEEIKIRILKAELLLKKWKSILKSKKTNI